MTQKEFEHNALQMRAKALAVAQGFGFSDDESEEHARARFEKLLEQAFEAGCVSDAVVAENLAQAP